jgi:hypothetical protein
MYDTKGGKQNEGDPLPNPDLYIEPGKPGATGYDRHKDKGLQLVLKENNDNKVAPSMYNPWDLPGSVGGSDYSDNISGCNPNMIPIGHKMTPENGNMEGPTKHGADELIAQDPKAYWSDSCKCVKGSDPKFRQSPRIRMMPLYNPVIYAEGQKTGKSQPQVEVVNYLGVFVESVSPSGEVIGRVTPVLGKLGSSGTPPVGAFASYIMLVK